MTASGEGVVDHFLFPTNIFVGHQPSRVQTILGSCVSVCLYDEILGIGGMNHFMLPLWKGQGLPSPKYGDIAINKLIEKMLGAGCRRENLVAKVFGGASQMVRSQEAFNVAEKNVAVADSILSRERIRVIARNTGGTIGRKLVYHTQSNQVLLKFLESLQS